MYNTIDYEILKDDNIDIQRINDMNIILNDNDCSNSLFNGVCECLIDKGMKFKVTKDDLDLPSSNAVVITLDEQYSSGYNSLVFAPFNNTRLGFSDSLALSIRAGMVENNSAVAPLVGGKVGYQVDEFGNISTLVPTSTEEVIGNDGDTTFVTISIGTEEISAESIARGILSGLAREIYFLDNYDSQTDLVYRANLGESVKDVADYFGVDVNTLVSYNHLPDKSVLNSQTIINPNVEKMKVFNPQYNFLVSEDVVHKSL